MSRDLLNRHLPSAREALDALDDAHCAQLTQHLRAARTRQQQALKDTLDSSLRFVPALLRGPLKRILFR